MFFLLLLLACTPQTTTSAPLGVRCDDPVSGIDRFTRDDFVGFETAFEDTEVEWGTAVAGMAPLAVEDMDGDGDLDVLQSDLRTGPWIYLNDGSGHFGERIFLPRISQNLTPHVMGLTVANLDNDGLPEVIVVGPSLVVYWKDLGNLSFSQPVLLVEAPSELTVYQQLGIADINGDGQIDLVLPANTLASSAPGELGTPAPTRLFYGPDFWEGQPLLDDGIGNLSLASLVTDRDLDGDMDLLILPDRLKPGAFWRNDGTNPMGEPIFVDDPQGADQTMAAMGVDSYDLNDDGLPDYCASDTGPPRCFLSSPNGYVESAAALGFVPATQQGPSGTVGWSFDLQDLDNDGFIDAFQASGPPTEQLDDPAAIYPDLLFQGRADGFHDVSHETGLDDPAVHDSSVLADFDGDGSLDILVGGPGAPPLFYRNHCGAEAWLEVELEGREGNLDAYGARVRVAGQTREIYSLRSPASQPSRLHFGLGDLSEVDVEIHWPDGVETVNHVHTRQLWRAIHP